MLSNETEQVTVTLNMTGTPPTEQELILTHGNTIFACHQHCHCSILDNTDMPVMDKQRKPVSGAASDEAVSYNELQGSTGCREKVSFAADAMHMSCNN